MGFENLVFLWKDGGDSRKISRVNLAEGAYLYKLVHNLSAPYIVEIGTMRGGTTKLLEEANQSGVVFTVDLAPNIETSLGERAHSIVADSTKIEVNVDSVDLLFIDGNHFYEGVKADWDNWNKAVKIGGHIVFHDCYIVKKKYKTVIDLIKELKNNKTIGNNYVEQQAVASLCHLIKVG